MTKVRARLAGATLGLLLTVATPTAIASATPTAVTSGRPTGAAAVASATPTAVASATPTGAAAPTAAVAFAAARAGTPVAAMVRTAAFAQSAPFAEQTTTVPPGPRIDPADNARANAEKTKSKIIVGVLAAVLAVIVIWGRSVRKKRRSKSADQAKGK